MQRYAETFRTADFESARTFSFAGFGLGSGLASGAGLIVSGRRERNRRKLGAGIALTTLSAVGSGTLALFVSLKGMSH